MVVPDAAIRGGYVVTWILLQWEKAASLRCQRNKVIRSRTGPPVLITKPVLL